MYRIMHPKGADRMAKKKNVDPDQTAPPLGAVWFYTYFLCFFHMAGHGIETLGDKILMSTESSWHFAHLNISLNSWLYTHFSMFFHMYISAAQGQTNPWGQKFDANGKALSVSPLVASFKNFSFNSDFIHIFLMFFHMYIAPGQG